MYQRNITMVQSPHFEIRQNYIIFYSNLHYAGNRKLKDKKKISRKPLSGCPHLQKNIKVRSSNLSLTDINKKTQVDSSDRPNYCDCSAVELGT